MSQPLRYPHKDLTHEIIGAFYEVYNELGSGFREVVYERALHLALGDRGLRSERQRPGTVRFQGRRVGLFQADLVVNNTVAVELKALLQLEPSHVTQTINLLRATGLEVGLLLNFGPKPQIKRLVFTRRERPG